MLLLLSRFSRVQLCATLYMAAHQAPPSLEFSRQEHWSGLPFPSLMHESEKWKWKWSRSVVSDSSRPHGLQPTSFLHPWDFPGKSTRVGCHHLLCDIPIRANKREIRCYSQIWKQQYEITPMTKISEPYTKTQLWQKLLVYDKISVLGNHKTESFILHFSCYLTFVESRNKRCPKKLRLWNFDWKTSSLLCLFFSTY